jgi:hypothetical protein
MLFFKLSVLFFVQPSKRCGLLISSEIHLHYVNQLIFFLLVADDYQSESGISGILMGSFVLMPLMPNGYSVVLHNHDYCV